MAERTMHRVATGAALCCAMALPPGAAGAGVVDMQHIAVDLHFDWTARQAIATARLTLIPRQATRQVALDGAHLRIDSVVDAQGRELRFVNQTGKVNAPGAAPPDGALQVILAEPAAAGQVLTLTVAYRTTWVNRSDPANLGGSNGRGLRFLQPSVTEPARRRQIWASGEVGAVRWWLPGIDNPSALRSSELRATVPAPLQVVAGGRLVGVEHHADGSRTFHWRTERPEPHHRTTFVVGEFTPIPQHHARVELLNLGYPDEAAGVAASVVMHADALDFLTRLLGQPFPQPHHHQVFVQDLPWNTPGSGLSVLTENFVDDLGTHRDFQYLWDGLQTESLAQQWLGGAWPLCDTRHIWLERALAHHLAALYTEHRHGRDEFLLWYVSANQATALADASQGPVEPVLPSRPMTLDERTAFAAGNTPYFRGATVLHALRELLGPARWQRTLKRFAAAAAADGQLCTAQLQRAAEAEYGRPLAFFFGQWVLGTGHPVFEVETTWRRRSAGGRLEVEVRQVQAARPGEPPARYFEGPIDLLVDDRLHRVYLRAEAVNRFRFHPPKPPRLVHLDPHSAWLKELRHHKSDAELLHQLRTEAPAPVGQWAAAELMRRAQASGAGALREATVAALRERAASAGLYWRARFLALGQLATLLAPQQARQPAVLDEATTQAMLGIVQHETGWLRSAAVRVLGLARSTRHAALFQRLLHDDSDRVVNAAAVALGRSGAPGAYEVLVALPARPSWKNQSLISALNGLAELGDPRGRALALAAFGDLGAAHWTLATPVWDHRLAAVDTLVALDATEAATAQALTRFDAALAADELYDTFFSAQMLAGLGDAAAARIFPALQARHAADPEALKVAQELQARFESVRQRRSAR